MMKKVLSFLMAMTLAVMTVSAQTFTVDNADGVTINYSVLSADDHTVRVESYSYSGRIIVPDTVMYNDVAWTVTSIGTAFSGTQVTHLGVPATVTALTSGALANCHNLDTVWLASVEPVAVPMTAGRYRVELVFFANSYNVVPTLCIGTKVVVPCGSLKSYRDNNWDNLPTLTSPCAVPIAVQTSVDSLYRFDSIVYLVGNQRRVHFSNRSYEVGDTARVMAERWKVLNEYGYGYVYPRFGYFMGWSNGATSLDFSFVVEHADTILCIADTFHYETLSASRISTPVFQFGTLSYDGNEANYRFPDLGNVSTVNATGLWVGSSDSLAYNRESYMLEYDSSVTAHTAVARFFADGTDYFPGPLRLTDGGTDVQTVMDYNRVWKITREMVDYHVAHCAEAGYLPVEAIATWPGNGPDGYAAQLAPYFDADSDGVYNPLRGDYPVIRGDECVFSIFNDAFGEHNESHGQSLGIEVHAMTYAFHEPADTALWNTVFVHYDVFNRSAMNHPNTFFGAWSDFDLGYAYDDLMGCDVRRGMYFAYNGRNIDGPGTGCFEGVPPAQGCVILGGAALPADGQDNPAITIDNFPAGFTPGDTLGNMGINGMNFGDGITDNERIGMTSYMQYYNSNNSITGEPTKATDYYNFMHSYWKNWQHVKYGGDGLFTTDYNASFMFPDDSDPWHWGTNGIVPEINPNDWNEITAGNAPGDRRGIAGSGPFTFTAGGHQQFDLAYVTGFGDEDSWSSVEAMKLNADNVRRQFVRDTTDSGRPFVYMPFVSPVNPGPGPGPQPEGIDDVKGSAMQVYPNPTTGKLQVFADVQQVQLLDLMGRTLMTARPVGGVFTLDLTEMPQGIYILRAGGAAKRIVKK